MIAAAGKTVQTTHNLGLPYADDDYVAFEVNPLGRNYFRGSALAKIMRADAGGREVELIGHRFNQGWVFTTKIHGLMRWGAATLELATTPITLPAALPAWLSPPASIVAGQLLALALTLAKGYQTDHPRGLRKVTETQ